MMKSRVPVLKSDYAIQKRINVIIINENYY